MAALLAVLLLAVSFSACGSTGTADVSGTEENSASVSQPEEIKTEETVSEPYVPVLPTGPEESEIFVTKIDGIPDDFIRGMDISSLLTQEASGVKYYDEAGNEADLLKILADAGLNYVRVRVWNDPYDEEGHGYGGGNCDLDTAVKIGQRAAKYGLKTCVDFHYSDFWADPKKQMSPKAWKKMDVETKISTIRSYTAESLKTLLDAGVDVGMVQIGNETNNGIAGVKSQDNLYKMIASGCAGARDAQKETGKDFQVAVHFTQIDDHDDILRKAQRLKAAEADYDIFGVSYYTYWHGDFENMKRVLSDLEKEFGVKTCVMETAYPYTSEDGDGTGNSVAGNTTPVEGYPVSVQGQAKNLRDVMANAYEAGALGVFYWEGAWIPVSSDYTENQKKWEEFGSGWASSFASVYDPEDAGKFYGGSSWDNQALFDFTGHPLPSLNVFKYVKYGATAPLEVLAVKKTELECPLGEELSLPDTVEVFYNDSARTEGVPVKWNEEEAQAIDVMKPGKYTVSGYAEFEGDDISHDVEAVIKISAVNYLLNGSFEEEDASMWEVSYNSDSDPTDIQDKAADAASGSKAFHFWSTSDIDFRMFQTVPSGKLHAGKYTASCVIQGGDLGGNEEIYLFAIAEKEVQSDKVKLTGWQEWKDLTVSFDVAEGEEVTVGVAVKGDAKGWGTIDDFELFVSGN